MTTDVPPERKTALWRGPALRILVSLGLVAVILLKLDTAALSQVFSQMNVGLYALSLLLAVPGFAISVVRWRLLLRAVGQVFGAGHLLASYLVASFFNLVLPFSVGGDLIRTLDTRRESFRVEEAAGVVLVDRLTGVLSVLVLLAIGWWQVPEGMLTPYLPTHMPLWPLVAGGVLLVGLWWWRGRSVGGILGFLPAGISARLRRFADTLRLLARRRGALLQSALLGLAMQCNVLLFMWLIALSLHLPFGLGQFFWFYPCWFLLTMLVPSVGGHGVRESAAIFLLVPLLGTEQAMVTGTAMGLLFGLSQLPPALVGWWIHLRRGRREQA